MLVVGLTGGIASGKTTVAEIFRAAGADVLDADQIARQVVGPSQPAWQAIVDVFGKGVLQPDNTIDRKQLGAIVFNDERLRKQLETIIHPFVRKQMEADMAHIINRFPHALIVQDVPLLFEADMQGDLAEVIVVYVNEPIQIQRLMQRDGIHRQEALIRIRAQMPIEKKKNLATILIDNSGSRLNTEAQALRIYNILAERARKRS